MRLLILGTALVLTLGAGSLQAAPLQENRAGSCVLGGGVAAAIKAALIVANKSQKLGLDVKSLSVDSIVIRSAENPNGGQRLAGNPAKYTGAVVCTFNQGILPPAVPYSVEPTSANNRIENIDLLSSQIDTWLQYKKTGPTGKIENLLCLSTRGNNDCFSVYRTGVPR